MRQNFQRRPSSTNLRPILRLGAIILAVIIFLWRFYRKPETTPEPDRQEKKDTRTTATLNRLEIPARRPGEQIVDHEGFTLSYNEEHEQAAWVAYKLKKKGTANHRRTDKFLEDPMVHTGSADDADYNGSGYDRGHLAPAEDMDWSKASMAESFYFSNMSPQQPHFNRGVWRRLEELVRFWAGEYDSIFIVTGPVLTNDLAKIGHNEVSVPVLYYKAILKYHRNEVKAVGFVLPNEPSAAALKDLAVPVDSVEGLTGIDLFPRLPDETENTVESDPDINAWKWSRQVANKNDPKVPAMEPLNNHKESPSDNSTTERSVAVQCSGITKAGSRCRRTTTSSNGRCWQHGGN